MLHNGNMLQLRRYSLQDAVSILTWPQSSAEARWWAGPQTRWPISPDVFQRRHDDPEVHPYILSNQTTLLGYGEIWVDADEQEVELARLIVAPQHRGQGIGGALVRLLVEEARHTGYSRVFLRVFPDNHGAIACYLRTGFMAVSAAEQQSFNQGQPIAYHWMSQALSRS